MLETEIKIWPESDSDNSNPPAVTFQIKQDTITLDIWGNNYDTRSITFNTADLIKVLRLIEFVSKD